MFIQGIGAWLGLRLVVFAFGNIKSSGRGLCMSVNQNGSTCEYTTSWPTLILKLLRLGGSHVSSRFMWLQIVLLVLWGVDEMCRIHAPRAILKIDSRVQGQRQTGCSIIFEYDSWIEVATAGPSFPDATSA